MQQCQTYIQIKHSSLQWKIKDKLLDKHFPLRKITTSKKQETLVKGKSNPGYGYSVTYHQCIPAVRLAHK